MALSTVSAVLTRIGWASCSRSSRPEPPTVTSIAERASWHVDVKKLRPDQGRRAPRDWQAQERRDNGGLSRAAIHALVIRTLVTCWTYGAIYGSSTERTAALDGWLWTDNHRRPHGALSHKPPIAGLNELNNQAGSYG